jgi:hypothetical protein
MSPTVGRVSRTVGRRGRVVPRIFFCTLSPPTTGAFRVTDPSTTVSAPRSARWLPWLAIAIASLVLLRLAAPFVIAPLIAARISAALDAHVEIDDVDLHLLARKLTVHGITASPRTASASRIEIEALTLHVAARDLFRGLPFLHARASGVVFTLDVDRRWPRPDDDTADTSPSPLRSASVERGRLALVLTPDLPAVDVLTNIDGALVDTSTGRRTTELSTRVSFTATAGEDGSLAVDGLVAPVASAASWSLSFAVDRLDLRPFNPLFQSFFEMDVEQGWLSLRGELNVGLGRMRGRLMPQFHELQLLGRGEERVRHPMAEALFGTMLATADIPIVIDEPAPFEAGFAAQDVERLEPMRLLEAIIGRGLARRLDTLAGYESSVGAVELDFPTGRMSFFDVTLTKTGGTVDTPFVAVERLDIVVEQSAVDSDIPTYKAVTLHRPSLVFVTGEDEASSQLRFDPLWQDKVSVLPYPTDRIVVKGGRVEYRDDTTDPPTSLYAADIDLVVDNLGRARADTIRRAAPLRATARAMDISTLRVEADLSPGAVPIDASVRVHMDPLPLRELNDLLRGRMQVDVSGGTLAVAADVDAFEGRVRGTVSPALPGIAVIGSKEVEFQRPIRELMLERRLRRLDGKSLAVDYTVQESLLRELPSALFFAALRAE